MEVDDDAYLNNNNNNYNQNQNDDVYNYQPYDYQDDALQQNYYGGGGDDAYNNYQYADDNNNYANNNNNYNNNGQSGYSYFYTGIAKMKEVYDNHGVPYYPCKKLAGLTVEEAMELADLSSLGGKGYLLAVDRHDAYGKNVCRVDVMNCDQKGELKKFRCKNNDNTEST